MDVDRSQRGKFFLCNRPTDSLVAFRFLFGEAPPKRLRLRTHRDSITIGRILKKFVLIIVSLILISARSKYLWSFRRQMIESHKLPRKLRRNSEKEIELSEVVHWIEQLIPRIFTRFTMGTCLVLLFSSSFFAFVGFGSYEQARNVGISIYKFLQAAGILIPVVTITIQLMLIFIVPFLG